MIPKSLAGYNVAWPHAENLWVTLLAVWGQFDQLVQHKHHGFNVLLIKRMHWTLCSQIINRYQRQFYRWIFAFLNPIIWGQIKSRPNYFDW